MGCVYPLKNNLLPLHRKPYVKDTYLSQPVPCRLNSNVCLFGNARGPCLRHGIEGWFPLTVDTLIVSMREFLDYRGCLTHILLLNKTSFSPISSTASVVKWRWQNLPDAACMPRRGMTLLGISPTGCNPLKPSQFWPRWRILALPSHVFSGPAQIFLWRSTLHLPLWEFTVTTNVPMDGNDPRGRRDWQQAEWDQRLKGLRRGKEACRRRKNKKHVAKMRLTSARPQVRSPSDPELCLQPYPPTLRTAGAGQAWGPACSWVRSLLPHARPSYAGNRPS